jgi:hypothetical protein
LGGVAFRRSGTELVTRDGMNESLWAACGDPEPMLKVLRHNVSNRKLRWFAVACVRRMPPAEFTSFHWDVVHELEESIDGDELVPNPLWGTGPALRALITPRAFWAAQQTAARTLGVDDVSRAESKGAQCDLLREIFGNPYRPVTADSRWLTETAVVLATGIYADSAFDRMPILADALEEAGCDNYDVLSHCRDPNGVHVRGCWVVDMVLGKP